MARNKLRKTRIVPFHPKSGQSYVILPLLPNLSDAQNMSKRLKLEAQTYFHMNTVSDVANFNCPHPEHERKKTEVHMTKETKVKTKQNHVCAWSLPFHLQLLRNGASMCACTPQLQLQTCGKTKCSAYFLQLFFQFSLIFPNDMTKLSCFHHRSTNVCKNTVKVKAAFCSNEFLLRKMRKSAARLLRQLILHLLWQCHWNISYGISMHLVCVRTNFSAICRPAPSLGYACLNA